MERYSPKPENNARMPESRPSLATGRQVLLKKIIRSPATPEEMAILNLF